MRYPAFVVNDIKTLNHSSARVAYIYDGGDNNFRPLEKNDFLLPQDAFGRLRTSSPLTLFDSTHRYADNGLWNTATGGTGSVTFNANQGLVDLTISTGSGSYVYRETKRVFGYQPGKSLLSMNTFTMSPAQNNLVQRIGYFGSGNGIFVEQSGSSLSIVKRTSISGSPIDVKAPQSQWSEDKLNGSGYSQYNLNTTKSQIFWTDMEWLGAGTMRAGFVINGELITAHSFHHANEIEGTYMTTASLPLRYEIFNVGNIASSGTLKQICSTVISEGGYELRGTQQAVQIPITTPRTFTNTGIYYPMISLKLKESRLDAMAILTALSMLGKGSVNYSWRVLANGESSGGTWVSAGNDSSVQYSIDSTGISGGRILAAGFLNSSNQTSPSLDILKEALFKFQLERNTFTNTPYELSLAVACDTTAQAGFFASMDWEEVSR